VVGCSNLFMDRRRFEQFSRRVDKKGHFRFSQQLGICCEPSVVLVDWHSLIWLGVNVHQKLSVLIGRQEWKVRISTRAFLL